MATTSIYSHVTIEMQYELNGSNPPNAASPRSGEGTSNGSMTEDSECTVHM